MQVKVTINGEDLLVQMMNNYILGTRIRVWKRVGRFENGGTYSSFEDGLYMRVGCDPDRNLFDRLPVGVARSEAVRRAYQARYDLAHAAIKVAFDLPSNTREGGINSNRGEFPYLEDGEYVGGLHIPPPLPNNQANIASVEQAHLRLP